MVRGGQSYFVDPLYDPLRYLQAATDDTPGTKASVRRRGTLTGIATGSGALVAAGYRFSDKKHVHYSSAGPTRGLAVGPTCAAVTDQCRSLPGVLAAGTRGGSVARLIGTSTAAPQLARWVTNGKPPPGPIPGLPADPQLLRGGLAALVKTAAKASSSPTRRQLLQQHQPLRPHLDIAAFFQVFQQSADHLA